MLRTASHTFLGYLRQAAQEETVLGTVLKTMRIYILLIFDSERHNSVTLINYNFQKLGMQKALEVFFFYFRFQLLLVGSQGHRRMKYVRNKLQMEGSVINNWMTKSRKFREKKLYILTYISFVDIACHCIWEKVLIYI